MKLIQRIEYINRLLSVVGTPDIKVITGIRRSGKSKLMDMFMERLKKENRKANVIHVNFNDPKSEPLAEYHALYDFVQKKYKQNVPNFVFIDEVQMCKGFEKAINGLHATEKFDIYITGSNAFLLSSDLSTLFTGRTFAIEMFPFSFVAFMRCRDAEEQVYGDQNNCDKDEWKHERECIVQKCHGKHADAALSNSCACTIRFRESHFLML